MSRLLARLAAPFTRRAGRHRAPRDYRPRHRAAEPEAAGA